MKRKIKRRRHKGPIHVRVASLRIAKGWSQDELADKLGVDKTAVSHWETGVSRPEISRLQDLVRVFDVPLAELIEGEPAYEAIRAAMEAA